MEKAHVCGRLSQASCLLVSELVHLKLAPEVNPESLFSKQRSKLFIHSLCSQCSIHGRLYPLPPTCTIFLNYLLWPEVAWEKYLQIEVLLPDRDCPYLALCVGALLGICSGVDAVLGPPDLELDRIRDEEEETNNGGGKSCLYLDSLQSIHIWNTGTTPGFGCCSGLALLSSNFSAQSQSSVLRGILLFKERKWECFRFDAWQVDAAHGWLSWMSTERLFGLEILRFI